MPRVAMDFSKTVIYHFVCQDEMIKCSYVGSTTNIVKRKWSHKSICHNENAKNHNLKLYQTIRENGGWNNWELKPLEEFPCENYTQQVIREQFWIDQLKPELNCRPAYQPDTQKYYQENREQRLIQMKEYAETNREHLTEYHKKYHESNKDRLNKKSRDYYEKNKVLKRSRASQNIHIDPSSMPVLDCQGPVEGSH
jgi:hypothetical protein